MPPGTSPALEGVGAGLVAQDEESPCAAPPSPAKFQCRRSQVDLIYYSSPASSLSIVVDDELHRSSLMLHSAMQPFRHQYRGFLQNRGCGGSVLHRREGSRPGPNFKERSANHLWHQATITSPVHISSLMTSRNCPQGATCFGKAPRAVTAREHPGPTDERSSALRSGAACAGADEGDERQPFKIFFIQVSWASSRSFSAKLSANRCIVGSRLIQLMASSNPQRKPKLALAAV